MGNEDFIARRLRTMANRNQISTRGRKGALRWVVIYKSLPDDLQAAFADNDVAPEDQHEAVSELMAIDRKLGERGARLVRWVLVELATAGAITARDGRDAKNGSRAVRKTTAEIEQVLETLADYFRLPGGGGKRVTRKQIIKDDLRPVREVDDPNDPERKIEAEYATKGDILGAMLADGAINKIQFDAGRRWQAVHELTEVGARGNRWTESVDGGTGEYTGAKDVHTVALHELKNLQDVIPWWDYSLLRQVLGFGTGLYEMTRPAGDELERFKAALDLLADVYSRWGELDRPGSRWAA